MLVIRYIFLGALVFNMLVLYDSLLHSGRFFPNWHVPTITELCLLALIVVLARPTKTIVYVNADGRWTEREHCEV